MAGSCQTYIAYTHLVGHTHTPPKVKAMAAILLRRIFLQLEYKDIAEDLPPDVLAASKAELFLALQSENSALVRKKICDAVAEMGRSFLGVHVCVVIGNSPLLL